MKIYDSHLHLNNKLSLNLALREMLENTTSANVSGGFVLHQTIDKWEFTDLATAIKEYPSFYTFRQIDPNQSNFKLEKHINQAKDFKAIGVKLHPRAHSFNLDSKKVDRVTRIANELNLIVNICSFDDGSWGRIGLSPHQFLGLADKYPNVDFLWSHSGGYRVLEFMFMARRCENVYLDTSFTQDYFFKGSVVQDLVYATESLSDRYLFGTDFINKDYRASVEPMISLYLNSCRERDDLFQNNFRKLVEKHG